MLDLFSYTLRKKIVRPDHFFSFQNNIKKILFQNNIKKILFQNNIKKILFQNN